ncbi:MAG TPA: hypothetical protein VKZ87_16325 [Ferrovibrio sp.]|uniref:hypothetical protein n=1 Tax=Ferrovibrio sp. TaxID=1917215 RepID=UPI002B4AFBBE|nr:hypothetical protein [Ferrovibrio sp.]HLT78951.1 hypothetical protein [Ferrovibrio sp.]
MPQLEILRQRMNVPQMVYVCGPAGGGKTRLAMLIAWTYFQAHKRPFRMDGADMSPDQIRQSAREKNCGILFNDLSAAPQYAKAALCVDSHMVALGVPFDGPGTAAQAREFLYAYLPKFALRRDLTVLAVARSEAALGRQQAKVDLLTA